MKIEFITIDDLKDFKDTIVREITSNMESRTQKKWVRSAEVRGLLGISSGTLQKMRINQTIPYSRMGKTFFYDWDDIQKILIENKSC